MVFCCDIFSCGTDFHLDDPDITREHFDSWEILSFKEDFMCSEHRIAESLPSLWV